MKQSVDEQKGESSRLPSLDGWRAVSIALVLVQHSYVQHGWPESLNFAILRGIGGVGVRFFFVLSGFLITYLMLREIQKSGAVDLRGFYIRRCLRILPVYFSFLIFVALVQFFGQLQIPWQQWLYAITFTVNFGGANIPLGHLWTLGVEEQFYLLWPPIVATFCALQTRRLVFFVLIPIVFCPILRLFADHADLSQPLAATLLGSHSFFTICDGLAIGSLGAVLFTWANPLLHKVLLHAPILTYTLGCVLTVSPTAFWVVPPLKSWQFLQDSLQCTGFLILLLHSIIRPRWLPYLILNWKPVVYFGVLSYSLYLWQGIFEVPPYLWPFPMEMLHGFPNWLIGVFAASILSYHFIELPILKRKAKFLRLLKGKTRSPDLTAT